MEMSEIKKNSNKLSKDTLNDDSNDKNMMKNNGDNSDKFDCTTKDNKSSTNKSNGDGGAGSVLKPGSKIKPEISIDDAEKLAQRLYGIIVNEIKELNAYDDRNYYICEDRNIKNPLITNGWPHGYVMKIINAHESKKLDFIDAQTQIMIYLRQNGIICPNPVKNVHGQYYSVENLNGNQHVVRLLEFIPGKILHEVPFTNNLFYQCGEFVAKFDKILKNFHHDVYKSHKSIWQLQSIPKLKEFLYVIEDHGRKLIIEEIIEAFELKVLPHLNVLDKGIIHGDFNEQNIIVKKINNNEELYKIYGILDFGDTNYGPLVFELSIAMTYMILQSKDLSTGGLIMAGYNSIRKIPNIEKEILKECIAARLCQSLVLGTYSYTLNPGNDYILTTQKIGWEILESLWKDNLDKVDELWKNTADYYLTQSLK